MCLKRNLGVEIFIPRIIFAFDNRPHSSNSGKVTTCEGIVGRILVRGSCGSLAIGCLSEIDYGKVNHNVYRYKFSGKNAL